MTKEEVSLRRDENPAMTAISIRGAREHNLKNLSLDLPRGAVTVFTGVSGSGKSTLVLDIVHREGQRRFFESLSSYARRVLGALERPMVDQVEGLSPTVCIDQRTSRGHPRSTVGTITEIHDHLRLLYARLGVPHCPNCSGSLETRSADTIAAQVLLEHEGATALILAPVVRARRGAHRALLIDLQRSGFHRLRVDGTMTRLRPGREEDAAALSLDGRLVHSIDVVYDRLSLVPSARSRLTESVEGCMELAEGEVCVAILNDPGDSKGGESPEYTDRVFSGRRACPKCGTSFPELEPRLFSFNSPAGACPRCRGTGRSVGLDVGSFMGQRQFSVDELVLRLGTGAAEADRGTADAIRGRVESVLRDRGFGLNDAWHDLPEDLQDSLLYGRPLDSPGLEGLVGDERRVSRDRFSLHEETCPRCRGMRLGPFALAVTFRGLSVGELSDRTIGELADFFADLELEANAALLGRPIVAEIGSRLEYLMRVGLPYLTLSRSADTLSGGEAQRVQLASLVAGGLQGAIYVLDEPSVGLHPRDTGRLLRLVRQLCARGNTVLLVEHDEATIRAADYIVDLGPGAGVRGGHIIAKGSVQDLSACDESLTGAYLDGRRSNAAKRVRRGRPERWLEIYGACCNNLKDIDVLVPLGRLVAVTGISGSGKSSLVHGVIRPALRARSANSTASKTWRELRGAEGIGRVIEIDQKPLGRSSRSNPATYTKIFQSIRELFAATAVARSRNYGPARFSFNSREGRCFACRGAGVVEIDMEFLPSVEVPCDECEGQRYSRETLEVTYRSKSIAQVLGMSVSEAKEFFRDRPGIAPMLELLERIGLGYLELGRPSSTLSGGEAQRVKLAAELGRTARTDDLFTLDEPTTGLHFHDIGKLLDALQALVDQGNTVLVIEHQLDVIRAADHVIDLGPEGGKAGGEVVATGTPEEVAANERSHTGCALRGDLMAIPEEENGEAGEAGALQSIVLRGGREHNLKSVDVTIPHGELTVVTGISGSGKSSIAFDTIYAEAQRRYIQALSIYARRFFGRFRRPRFDRLDGLAPAIAIDQRGLRAGPHSTVGTVTEIYHHLRLLFARVGEVRCPRCRKPLRSSHPSSLAVDLVRRHAGARGYILAPLDPDDVKRASADAASVRQWAGRWIQEGFSRLVLGGEEVRFDLDANRLLEVLRATPAGENPELFLVVDRVAFEESARPRIASSLERAFWRSGGHAAARVLGGALERFSVAPSCPDGHFSMEVEITPRLFAFTSHAGACPRCQGTSKIRRLQPESLLVAPQRPLFAGALDRRVTDLIFTEGSESLRAAEAWAAEHSVALDRPVDSLDADARARWLRGEPVGTPSRWPGIFGLAEAWYDEHRSRLKPRVFASMSRELDCPDCRGSRISADALRVCVRGRTLADVVAMTIAELHEFFATLQLTEGEATTCQRVVEEIRRRLDCIRNIGLSYLTLGRASSTLSAGEAQRLRIAAQVAARMTGVLYVFDEPTVGLHPRDTANFLRVLEGLRETRNTVVVVEHDRDVIERADHIIELGPGAGPHGGHVIVEGSLSDVVASADSSTGAYLRGELRIEPHGGPRQGSGELVLRGIELRNLDRLDVAFPLRVITAVTGVSGSGKSSLVVDGLAASVRRDLAGRKRRGRRRREGASLAVASSGVASIDGVEAIDRLVVVDQSPVGRTPRSNPATYTGVWDAIRRFYSILPASRVKGFGPDRFSFNVPGGRCEACRGEGAVLVPMHFLSDVWLTCEVCRGLRFNDETLRVRYAGRHVGDLLRTDIDEAAEVFSEHPRIAPTLALLRDVGLGYLQLGQAAPTLSGGEVQRLKLASELARRQRDGTLYILDEPTKGLHPEDLRKLFRVLERLVDGGGTVVLVEHQLDLIAACDHIIDLGPGGGPEGGRVVALGRPAEIAGVAASFTGGYLKEFLRRREA